MNHKKKKQKKSLSMRCPNCGGTMILRSADGIYRENPNHTMLYVCKHYPECDTYIRTHPGTTIPVGVPANRKLRALRNEAHHYFDQLYLSGIMGKRGCLPLAGGPIAGSSFSGPYWISGRLLLPGGY